MPKRINNGRGNRTPDLMIQSKFHAAAPSASVVVPSFYLTGQAQI